MPSCMSSRVTSGWRAVVRIRRRAAALSVAAGLPDCCSESTTDGGQGGEIVGDGDIDDGAPDVLLGAEMVAEEAVGHAGVVGDIAQAERPRSLRGRRRQCGRSPIRCAGLLSEISSDWRPPVLGMVCSVIVHLSRIHLLHPCWNGNHVYIQLDNNCQITIRMDSNERHRRRAASPYQGV